MNETRNNPSQPAWRPVGSGHHTSFICARCGNPKNTFGRRMQLVKGMRAYVCAECLKAAEK